MKSLRGEKLLMGEKIIGRVFLAQLTTDLKALDGLWVDRGFAGMRFLGAEHICVIGERCVVADAPGDRLRAKAKPLLLPALSPDGAHLGAIVDAQLNEITLGVEALVLSRGVWDDFLRGRERIERYRYDAGQERVLIPSCFSGKEVLIP